MDVTKLQLLHDVLQRRQSAGDMFRLVRECFNKAFLVLFAK